MRIAALLLSLALVPWPIRAAQPDLFDRIFERTQAIEKNLKTLTARFTETTESSLLKTPLVARGELAVARPMHVRLAYTSPERRTVLIEDKTLTVVWPDRPAERLDIGGVQRRVDQYFTGRSVKDLRGHFDITASESDPALRGTYFVDMTPRRKQIKEALDRLQVWVDQQSFLMRRMRMTFPGGDTKTLDFEDVETNVPVDPSLFKPPSAAAK